MKKKLHHTTTNQPKKAIVIDTIYRMFVQPFLLRYMRVNVDTNILKNMHGPYILLPNHSSSFDPIFYIKLCGPKIYFVVSDAQFRNIIIRIVMRSGGCIAIKKGQLDLAAVMQMINVVCNFKKPLCIFPEGSNTWDGASLPIIEGTGTLIKRLKVPVVCAHTHGAYLTYPRWGHKIRRGKIKIFLKTVLTSSQIALMNKKQIYQKISEELSYNEFEQQKLNPPNFVSPYRAEHVERVLFACPYCQQMQGIVSHRQSFHCIHCQHSWFMDLKGFFHSDSNSIIVKYHRTSYQQSQKIDESMYSWNKWQQQFLRTYIDKISKNRIIFYDEQCMFRYGTTRLSLSYGEGRFSITSQHLYFIPTRINNTHNILSRKIAIADIKAVNIQNKEALEWTINGMFYQIKSRNSRSNVYKYMIAIQYIQKNNS